MAQKTSINTLSFRSFSAIGWIASFALLLTIILSLNKSVGANPSERFGRENTNFNLSY